MRCGCPQCGTYMVQQEHGLSSGCICPSCLFTCHACMGTEQPPANAEELTLQAQLRARIREWEQHLEAND